MSKIANWVFGSFFRTIGRLLVFILLGVIIAHFIDFGSLKDNFSITDLFFDKVNAKEGFTSYKTQYDGNSNVLPTAGNNPTYYYSELYSNNTGLSTRSHFFGTNYEQADDLIEPFDYVEFQFVIFGQKQVTQSQTAASLSWENSEYCIEWTPRSSGGYTCTRVGQGQNTYNTIMDTEIKDINISLTASVISKNWVVVQCTVDMNRQTIICPLWSRNQTGFNRLQLQYSMNGRGPSPVYIGISRTLLYYNDTESSINNSINQQTQQQQQQHQETMNSTTTEAESEATSFFGDFEDQDFGGLSGIVTAPLNTIRSLLSSTCTNLFLPLPFVNENLTLPCMTSIYTQHFGAFFTLYQTIILAIVAYRCIRSIFYDVHGFTNPDDDRIEVMDL